MRIRNRCFLVIVFFLAVASLTVRTTTARVINPPPPPTVTVDPGDPDNPGIDKCLQSDPSPSGGLSQIAVCPTGSGMPRPPESGTREFSPARVPPVHGGDWRLGRVLMLLFFRLHLGR